MEYTDTQSLYGGGYTGLAQAIIDRAAQDLTAAVAKRTVYEELGAKPPKECEWMIKDCENFFFGEWYQALNPWPGELIRDAAIMEGIEKGIKKAAEIKLRLEKTVK